MRASVARHEKTDEGHEKSKMVKNLFNEQLQIADAFSEHEHFVAVCDDAWECAKSLPSNFFSLIVTSPPYNLGKEYEQRSSLRTYLAEQKPLISELKRALKHNGSLCWQVGNYVEDGEVFPLDTYYYDLFKAEGFKLRNRIIWHFEHGLHCSLRFSGRYETLLWFTKSDDYVFHLDSVRVPYLAVKTVTAEDVAKRLMDSQDATKRKASSARGSRLMALRNSSRLATGVRLKAGEGGRSR